jgi:hypothetical protein
MNLSDAETGCYIDGSHRSFFDFACLVIEMAHDCGFEMDWDIFLSDMAWLESKQDDEDRELEILNALDWTYEDALDYLNTNTRPGFVWVVEDQSLFLMTEEDADASQ